MEAEGRGVTWGPDEVKMLISVWGDDDTQMELEGSVRNKHVFEMISKKLRGKGFIRSGKQCQTKIKALKKDYKAVKDMWSESGVKPVSNQLQCEHKSVF